MMKRLFIYICSVIILTGCFSSEARKFIESEATQTEVKELVEETVEEEAVPIKATSGDARYKPVGKGGEDKETIRVRYKTVQHPTYYGYAFVNVDVDSKPRKLLGVSDTGMIDPFEFDLYNEIMIHTYQQAYKTPLNHMKEMEDTIPGLTYKDKSSPEDDSFEPYVNLKLDKEQLTTEKRNALFADYTADKFASPSEQEAKALLDDYLLLKVGTDDRVFPSDEREILPSIPLHYTYDGTFNEELLDELLDALLAVEGLPDAFFSISVKDTEEYEDIEPHEEPSADYFGNIRINGKLKEKIHGRYFDNEHEEE